MTKLIPLSEIPSHARAAERAARKSYPSRAAALDSAQNKLVVAPGCHSAPYFDPPVIGWTLTSAAAAAYAAQRTQMPDGSSHCRAALEVAS